MTKKHWKWIVSAAVLVILAVLWTWQYRKTQARFAPMLRPSSVEYYNMGDTVTIGPINAYNQDVITGYSFRVNHSQWMDYEDFLHHYDADNPLPVESIPDKILLINVTVRNENNDLSDFSLYNFDCGGTGVTGNFRRELLRLTAPELEDVQLQLEQGSEITVTLPCEILRSEFSSRSWRHLEDFPLYLSILEITEEYDLQRAVKVNG